MSTETKPLKLMPHTSRRAPNGNLLIEPGSSDAFELPAAFRPLFEAIERGASLAKVVDLIDGKSGPRFRLLKKFLIFLDEHDMIADRDYSRLAESLNAEYSWPTSLVSTELLEIPLTSQKKHAGSRLLAVVAFLLTTCLAISSLVGFLFLARPREIDEPSSLRALILFLITYSLARMIQGLWASFSADFAGATPRLDLVVEPFAVTLREEQRGKSLRGLPLLTGVLSLILTLGVAALASRLGRSTLEFDIVMMAGGFAFLSEANPYARSTLTDLLKALFSALQERGAEAGARESAIQKLHTAACVTWVLLFGLFFALKMTVVSGQLISFSKAAVGAQKMSAYALLFLIGFFTLSFVADVISAFSYDDASLSQIRRLWRRKRNSTLELVQGVSPSAQDLEQLPFLRQIPIDIRKHLLQAAQVRTVSEGTAICRQGDRDRNLFVVIEGRLAVAKTTSGGSGKSRRKVIAWLNPGAVFGENAFFFGQPRSADVVAMEAGRVLVLPHLKALNIEESEKSAELRVRIWFLQALVQNPFFKELPSESLDSILHAGTEQRFSAGTRVIQEGEEADACYFMVQGRASVTQKTRAVGKINAGDAFGEISILFPGTLRTATIVADTDLITIKIERDRFWKLLKSHLPLALEIERMGLRRMKQDAART